MITTVPRFAWIRIDGEPYKVARADWDFLGLPVYVDPQLPPGTVKVVAESRVSTSPDGSSQ